MYGVPGNSGKEGYYHGQVSVDAQAQIKNILLDTKVHALITQTTKYRTKTDSRPSVSWILESISEVPVPKVPETIDLFETPKD